MSASLSKSETPYGKCRCGCGQDTTIATKTRYKDGLIKGQPSHFLSGHARRKSPVEYVIQEAGYSTPCWLWQRALSIGGYGMLGVGGKTKYAHRIFYERVRGSLVAAIQLDHLCCNRHCVNPDHLEPVSRSENVRRGRLTKLTDEQLQAIRTDKTSSNRVLAEQYGVTRDYVACLRDVSVVPVSEKSPREPEQWRLDAVLRPRQGYGLCQCGCGLKTPIAQRNTHKRGHLEGEPIPYLVTHSRRERGPCYQEQIGPLPTPCWVWQWGKTSEGYGELTILRRPLLAHRLFYEDAHGAIAAAKHIDHLCRNRACVNPTHLQAVSPAENARRGAGARLTMELAQAIRKEEGNYGQIAEQYGISRQTVCDIKKGRKWRETK